MTGRGVQKSGRPVDTHEGMRQLLTTSGPATQLAGPPSVVLIPATLASIAVVRAALQSALAERCWEVAPMSRVLIATTEATANAAEHGSAPGELIEVTYQVGDTECFVRVMDGGSDDNWQAPTTPRVPAEHETSGRGLLLIANLAERVEVTNSGRGTEMRLTFLRAA